MAKYTMELRTLFENSNIDIVEIGLKNYPLYVFQNVNQNTSLFGKDLKGNPITNYRDYLNNKIIQHYYFREIGFETGHRFAFELNKKMSEIMPYYNQLYESIDIKFNPLWNVDLTETFTHEVHDSGTATANTTANESVQGNSTENGTNERKEELEQISDNSNETNSTRTPNINRDTANAEMNTPEVDMTVEQIREHSFISKAQHNVENETGTETNITSTDENLKTTNDNTIKTTNDNTVNSEQSSNKNEDSTLENSNTRTETYTKKQEGSSAGYLFTQNIEQWRKIMINIDMQIINELKDLFMGIF